MQEPRKIVVIGGGIAGLCAAVYAQKCGWLLGSNPHSAMYARWREIFDIDRLTGCNPKSMLASRPNWVSGSQSTQTPTPWKPNS
jgi:hypothetical protein